MKVKAEHTMRSWNENMSVFKEKIAFLSINENSVGVTFPDWPGLTAVCITLNEQGEPIVYIYGDPNSEEPTHTISLNQAKRSEYKNMPPNCS